jgi:hypothetical protein
LIIEVFLIHKKNAFSMSSSPLTEQYLFVAAIRVPFLSFLYFGFFHGGGIIQTSLMKVFQIY